MNDEAHLLHLTPDLIAGWRQRSLTKEEMVVVDDHLATCAVCRDALSGDRFQQAVARAIDGDLEEVRGEATHVGAAELGRWVDGLLGPVEAELVGAHLADCAACRAEADDLARFAATLAPGRGLHRRRAWAAIAASLAVLATAWLVSGDRTPLPPVPAGARPPVPEVSPPPTGGLRMAPVPGPDLVLRDGAVAIDATGHLHGSLAAAWRRQVETVLRRPELTLPAVVAALARDPERERAVNGSVPPVAPEEPVSRVVLDGRPTFRWRAAHDVVARVEVYDSSFALVTSSGPLVTSSWQPSVALPRATVLSWSIVVGDPGSEVRHPVPPAPPAVFTVAAADAVQEIEDARASGSRLLTGLALWRAGALREAAVEFAELAQDNPRSALADDLAASSARIVAALP